VKKILLVQTAFLVDVILATPVIEELKRIFPSAEIDVIVKKGNESLLSNNPYCSNVFNFNKKEGKVKELLRLTKLIRSNQYDLAINLHRFGSSGILMLLSKAHLKYGFKKNPFSFTYTKKFEHTIGNGQHEVERNLSIIKEFGAMKSVRPSLFPSQQHIEKIEQYIQEDFYCIAPASVWFTKQLPQHKWVEKINQLPQDAIIFLLGGSDDFDLCNELIQSANRKNCVNLAGKLNLLESAALISKAKRTFVNDSGPLHLASAMNAPVTAYFCSTTPKFGFGPLSEDAEVIETEEVLSCKPCGIHGYKACPKGHFKCGEKISI
jgi:heptosyltransferase-2